MRVSVANQWYVVLKTNITFQVATNTDPKYLFKDCKVIVKQNQKRIAFKNGF